MDLNKETSLMRIFLSNTDKFKNKPLYEVIVYAAQRNGIAGATVLKGIMGFGGSSRINSVKLWEVSEKLPLVIEIVDNTDKIERFHQQIKEFVEKIDKGIMVTIEKINVVLYKTGKKK